MTLETQKGATMPSNKRTKLMVLLTILLGVLGISLLAWFVWPSHYQYKQVDFNMLGRQEIREDRFTQEAHICGAGKWQSIEISSDGTITLRGVTAAIGVKGAECSHAPGAILVVLACIAVSEAVLVFFLVAERKKRSKSLAGTEG